MLGLSAQEQESAEVFLEEYTDQFQECFFEALKQKSIGNYDKAINLFLECSEYASNQQVLDYELARAYLANRQYLQAQDYALKALNNQPDNPWILNTLLDIVQAQGNDLGLLQDQIPWDNTLFRTNLASLYFQKENYANAQRIIKSLPSTVYIQQLERKISDSLKKQQAAATATVSSPRPGNPLEALRMELEQLQGSGQFALLESKAGEALERYPAQPWAYYMYGLALHRNGKSSEASGILESALDFLIDDNELQLKIYKELAAVYTALGNPSRANMYLSKIKSGS
jgi:tetratricopeptide (TPR) repeat protein